MDLPSVEACCNLLARGKVLSADEVRALRARWLRESKQPADVPQFLKWLVANQFLTEYQTAVLARGHIESLFIDQYKIIDRIGKGRMAGVYKASHQLGQLVAVKVLPPSKAKEGVTLARFKREARLALKLKHPNIVRTFQAGVSNGLHFLVMEYLEGETLEDVLQRRKKLPPNEAVRLIFQAMQGLQHVHEQGLVHRDLNPGNLMLVPAHTPGTPESTQHATVKVLDIGMGRALFDEDATAEADPTLTTEGSILGSPDYLSPEQARDAHQVDIRTDIYSLGCVLYHCLAGQPPFPDASRVRQLVRHATEQAKPLREFNPAVPDALQQVVSRLMAKDPNQRYATPEKAAQALQPLLSGDAAGPAEMEPRMREYLAWLEANVNVEPYLAEAVEEESPPPAPKPAAAPKPAPAPRAAAPARPAAKPASAPPKPRPVKEGVFEAVEEVEPVAITPTAKTGGGLGLRELIVFGIGFVAGGFAMLIVVGLGWLLFGR